MPTSYAASNINFTNPTQTITVSNANPKFKITVISNKSTGYSWTLQNYDAKLIIPVNNDYFTLPIKSNIAGAGGYEKWTFKAKPNNTMHPQITKLVLIYIRPWEPKQIAKTIEITVKILPHN